MGNGSANLAQQKQAHPFSGLFTKRRIMYPKLWPKKGRGNLKRALAMTRPLARPQKEKLPIAPVNQQVDKNMFCYIMWMTDIGVYSQKEKVNVFAL